MNKIVVNVIPLTEEQLDTLIDSELAGVYDYENDQMLILTFNDLECIRSSIDDGIASAIDSILDNASNNDLFTFVPTRFNRYLEA